MPSASLVDHLNTILPDLPVERRIEQIAASFSRPVFTTSLGLEDQLITACLASHGRSIKAATLQTGRLFPETLDLLDITTQRYNLNIELFEPEDADIGNYVHQHGLNGFYESVEARKACCQVRKVLPLAKALHDADAWITGLRREQSANRSEVPFAELDESRGLIKLNPLADVTTLESEAIHIFREVAAEFERPVMLYSVGKDSSVLLHLARKAFYPGKVPFPLLHIDTGWKFAQMLAFRDEVVREHDLDLITYTNPRGSKENITPFTYGSSRYTDIMKTEALRTALDAGMFDAAFGGARRDEEASRAKERVYSFRTPNHTWDPRSQRPELWSIYNGMIRQGESIRVFPLSNWTELDIWRYIQAEDIPIVPLYFAKPRPVVQRDGMLILAEDERLELLPDEQAEREQGITIDVAYRYFSTANRSYIVADTPGHEQYTGNMATGASTADLAVILVDARTGLQEQTRRHTMIVSLMGIRQVVLVVNKMDLVGYDRLAFQTISDDFHIFARNLPLESITVIPASAPQGENVTVPASSTMPWYNGPTLLNALEGAELADGEEAGFRFSVQRVCRPDESFRGYQGTITGGTVSVGDAVIIAPSGEQARIASLVTFDGAQARAEPGEAITITLDRNVDIARGDIITAAETAVRAVRQAEAKLVVLTKESIDPGKRYWLKSGSRRQRVRVKPNESLNLSDLTWSPANTLRQNAIATAELTFEAEAVFDLYDQNRATGSFILIDPDTLNTVAGGMIVGGLDTKDGQDETQTTTMGSESEETVTLSLPLDLARQLVRTELLSKRAHDVEIVRITRNRLGAYDQTLLD
eukprot:g17510.t1